ncbi:efflux RND transporter periplasmic adaptor subunit [Acidisoma cladoniae]|jgi:membrane fusion protein (multidrug efflux system)|uniref:efflux RND transporter periplasmic adaptor subunit n=1 Tax=Acidisoma cladoniae TaxID=3040935 RepID=UPI00254E01F9|nr:efflux RND transporter periplasmic adaptor subunit [Acidisoma sp. PAMC 29798]
MRLRFSATVFAVTLLSGVSAAEAQMGGPPTVGVSKATLTPIYKTSQYVGRVEAINHITLQARVTGFLQQRNFAEGSDVKKGQVLFVIEQPPYQAAVLSAQGAVSQAQAQLRNSQLTLGRSRTLLNTPAGQQSNVDTAVASAGSNQGQLLTAEAQLQQAEINLGYTTIASPIDGRIGLATDPGNVVSPTSGALAKIVSQDPEYITFPVSESEASQLEDEYSGHGGLASLTVKVQLPDGHMYDKTGKIDFTDISVSSSTDTLTLRATLPNPARGAEGATEGNRTLIDGGFVTVILQSQSAQQEVTIPRAAVLADQQGNYVYVLGPDSKVSRQNIAIGDADGVLAVVTSGLKAGDTVVADGVQRVKPGAVVKTVPYTPPNYGDGTGTNG